MCIRDRLSGLSVTEVSGGLLVSELVCSDIVGFDSAVLFELLLPFSVLSVLVKMCIRDRSLSASVPASRCFQSLPPHHRQQIPSQRISLP